MKMLGDIHFNNKQLAIEFNPLRWQYKHRTAIKWKPRH